MFSGFCISMRWIAVISEAVKGNKTTHTIVEYMQDPTNWLWFLGFVIVLGVFVLILHIIYKNAMRKPYEKVVRDYLKLAEKKNFDKERKEKLMQLLEKARTDEDLLNQLREGLFGNIFKGGRLDCLQCDF